VLAGASALYSARFAACLSVILGCLFTFASFDDDMALFFMLIAMPSVMMLAQLLR